MKKIIIVFVLMIFSVTSGFCSEYSVHKLPNGQTVIVQEVKNNKIVTIDTWVKTGSINENEKNTGVSHFLEHLFFKGTKLHPAGEFDRILEAKGAIVNAATSKDFTHYYITIPSEHFETALELHSDMLQNPQIPRKELEKERKVVLEEISKDANTPSKIVYDNLNDMMYGSHPYKRKVIGSADVISTITREEILEYFNKYYTPSNFVTLIVGDVDTENVLQKVSEYFSQDYKKPVKNSYKKEHQISSQKRKTEYLDTQTGYLMIGFRGADINNNDTYALDILAQILGGGKASKYYRNIKEQKGLAYSISCASGSYRDDGIFYITANFNPVNATKLENSIFNEIAYIQKYGVTDEELKTAINMTEQDTYYARESTSNITSELGYITAVSGDSDLYKNYVENIKKVTAKDVQNVAQKYLGTNKCAVSIALPQNMSNVATVEVKQHHSDKIGMNNFVEKHLLDNKSTLLYSPHKNNNIIAMSIYIKGGEFLENIAGEGTLAAGTVLKGTKKYSSQELSQIMEENGIKISPSSKEDCFIIDVQTTTSQIDLTFDILNEIINNPTFDEYEIEKKRSEILNKIKQTRDVAMNIALEDFRFLIFENSVYSHSNKWLEKSLPKVTKSDIVKYYNKIMTPENIIISVNGDIELNKIVNSFGEIFKDNGQPKFEFGKYKIAKLNSSKKSSKTVKDLQTSWMFLGWQTAGANDKKDFVTLKVINTILGSGMSSRLFRNLREQDGLAYQLGSNYSPKVLGGSFMVYVGTNPKTLNYSKEKILKEIEKLKMEFVSDSELKDAKDRLKGGFSIALETNSDKASAIAQFEAFGFGYDFMDTYIKMIDEITASDIVKVANKYFNNINVESVVK